MRRMLDPTKVGGLPSTIIFDKDGNREVKKNLKVDGKLTLNSLVSATNPDGDITKELGGGGTHAWEVIKYLSPRIAAKEYSIGEEINMGDSAKVKLNGSELSVMPVYPAIFSVDGVVFTWTITIDIDYPTKYVKAYVYCIKPGTVTHATEYSLKIAANKQE